MEDEKASLAREANAPRYADSEQSDARSRGCLDQQPIILEADEAKTGATSSHPKKERRPGSKTSGGSLKDPLFGHRPPYSRQTSKENDSGRSVPKVESGKPPELSSRPPSTYAFTPRSRNESQPSVVDSGYMSSSESRAARHAEKRKADPGHGDAVMSDALRGEGKSRESTLSNQRNSSGLDSDAASRDASTVQGERTSNRYSYTKSDLSYKDGKVSAKEASTGKPKFAEAKENALNAGRRSSDTETTLPRPHLEESSRHAAAVRGLTGAAAVAGAAAYAKSARSSTSRPSSPVRGSSKYAPSPPRSPRPVRPHYKEDSQYSGRSSGHNSLPGSREGSRPSSPNRFDHGFGPSQRVASFPAVPDDRTQRTSRLISSESTPEVEPYTSRPKRLSTTSGALPYPIDDMNLMPSEEDHRYKPRPLDSSTGASIPAHKQGVPKRPKGASLVVDDPLPLPRLDSRHTINTGDLPKITTGSVSMPTGGGLVESPLSTRGFESSTPRPPPPCPRPTSTRHYDDWYTLDKLSSFDICPTCYEASFATSPFRRQFKRASPKDPKQKTKCDFASPWTRLAWLVTQQQQRHELDLLYAIARISASEDCPGNHKESRTWYTVLDRYGEKVDNFDVCSTDVRRVEALMPSMSGLYTRNHHGSARKRKCDFRIESKRFPEYLDTLIAADGTAQTKRRPPDLQRFADLVRQKAQMRECSKDDLVVDVAWHFPPHLPDLTVCEECYTDVIWPAIAEGSSVASRFSKTPQLINEDKQRNGRVLGTSCQLYSMRMRKVFKKAVQTGDFGYLARRAQERRDLELELQSRHANIRKLTLDLEKQGMKTGYATPGLQMQLDQLAEEWRKYE